MIGLIIIVVILVAFIGFGTLLNKHNHSIGNLLYIFGGTCIIILCFLIFGRSSRDKKERYYLMEYSKLRTKVEVISNLPDSIKTVIDTYYPEIKTEVEKMNQLIENNKANVSSIYNGWLFSDKLANLEPLEYE